MSHNQFSKLIAFLERLEEAKIAYTLGHFSYDAIMVTIVVPGEHWEVDFLDDGEIYVERFAGNGKIYDESVLEELFANHSSNAEPSTTENATPHDAVAGK